MFVNVDNTFVPGYGHNWERLTSNNVRNERSKGRRTYTRKDSHYHSVPFNRFAAHFEPCELSSSQPKAVISGLNGLSNTSYHSTLSSISAESHFCPALIGLAIFG